MEGDRAVWVDSEEWRAIVRRVDSEVSDSEEWRAIVRSMDSELDSEEWRAIVRSVDSEADSGEWRAIVRSGWIVRGGGRSCGVGG